MIDFHTLMFTQLLFMFIFQRLKPYIGYFILGLIMPLGFAPFHLSGLIVVVMALFYHQLSHQSLRNPALIGLSFGMGFFGCGISWVGISVHNYGHVNFLLSTFITLIFVLYLALFTALCTIVFCKFNQRHFRLLSGFLFSSLWVLCEYLRAHLLTGFPWLLLGFSQINTPFKFYLPFIGVYGVSFLVCLSATLCVYIAHSYAYKRMIYTFFLVGLYLGGLSLQTLPSIHQSDKPISVGVIQANLSMRDKWNEALFEQLLYRYQQS